MAGIKVVCFFPWMEDTRICLYADSGDPVEREKLMQQKEETVENSE